MGDDQLRQRFERLKQKVLAKRPILGQILRKEGQKNLLEYANEYVDVNLSPALPKRQVELLETVHELTQERFGKDVADSVVKQLKDYYFVSTADHMGPLTHPFFVNSNLLTVASLLSHPDSVLKNIIVLGCANVSYNNSSFPKGLLFHSCINKKLTQQRLSFLPSKPDRQVVYSISTFNAESLKKVYKELGVMLQKNEIGKREYDILYDLIKEIYDQPEILAGQDYCEQSAKTNFKLWKKFFQTSGITLPNLIHLEKEWVVVKLISKYHLDRDTIINHVLFDPAYESYINNYFEGIYGSFSRKDLRGTYLFWALQEGHRDYTQLWREGNYLVSKDGSYKIELHPEVIKKAMDAKELIPNILLKFMVICFYYGLKCLGGFNQVNYLTLMKNNYIKMNADLGNYRSIEMCARTQTKEMIDGLSLAFLETPTDPFVLATGLDLILYGKKDGWENIMNVTRNVTFEEAFNPLLAEIYKISYDKKEWEEDLITIKDSDIFALTDLNKKTKVCASINLTA